MHASQFSCEIDSFRAFTDVTFDVSDAHLSIAFFGGRDSGCAELALALSGLLDRFTPARFRGEFVSPSARLSACGLVREESCRVGYCAPDPADQIVGLTSDSELAWAHARSETDAPVATAALREFLERLELGRLATRSTATLSSGERQRLAIASIAIAEPTLLVLDSCLWSLDSDTVTALGEFIAQRKKDGKVTWNVGPPCVGGAPHSCTAAIGIRAGRLLKSWSGSVNESIVEQLLIRPEREKLYRSVVELVQKHCKQYTVDAGSLDIERVILDSETGAQRRLDVQGIHTRGGECLGVAGVNGSGKSSLLSTLAGLERSVESRICWSKSADDDGLPPICYLSPDGIPAWIADLPPSEIWEASGDTADQFARLLKEDRYLSIENGSYRARENPWRRLWWIAHSIVANRTWLILDEPTTGMDGSQRNCLRGLLNAHKARGGGALVASHDHDFLDETCGHRIVLSNGRVAEGMPTVSQGTFKPTPPKENLLNASVMQPLVGRLHVAPLLKIFMGLCTHSVVLIPDTMNATSAIVTLVVAWLILGGMTRNGLLLWAGLQIAIAAIFSASYLLGADSQQVALRGFLNWSAGSTAGVMVVLWPGVEDLARCILSLPIPDVLTKSFGFALRTAPVVATEVRNHKRNLQILRRLGARISLTRHLSLAISEVLVQSIARIDKIVVQIEVRGYDIAMFGKLRPLMLNCGNTIAVLACLTSTIILIRALL